MGGRRKHIPEDVWKKIKKGNNSDCWEWTGVTSHNGYGEFCMDYEHYPAHRVVYWLTHPGSISLRNGNVDTDSLLVLHKCDNPPCCNPNHLFLGKPNDNLMDMMAKGRRHNFDGEKGQNSKLSNEDAKRIREATLFGARQKDLAQAYGVSASSIHYIVKGRTYRFVE